MKELIFQDDKAIQKEIKEREKLISYINEFMSFLENKGIKPKQAHVINFVTNGISYMQELLYDDAKKEIKRLKINSVSIQNNMLAGIEKQAQEFEGILSQILEQTRKCNVNITNVSFNENKPEISGSDIKEIKEMHSVYIQNEKQEKLWNLQVEFAKAFNQFEDGLKEHGLNSTIYFGTPDKLKDYLHFQLKEDAKINNSMLEEMKGFPRSGGVIIKPNPMIHKSI